MTSIHKEWKKYTQLVKKKERKKKMSRIKKRINQWINERMKKWKKEKKERREKNVKRKKKGEMNNNNHGLAWGKEGHITHIARMVSKVI